MADEEDIETKALRRRQAEIADAARDEAEQAPTEEHAVAMDRRAEKAEYLKQKLDERAQAERESSDD